MKVLAFNIKGAGHVNPTLPVVRALTERGHDVTYVLSPEWKDAIEKAGARYVNTGPGETFTTADYNPGKFFPLQLIPAAAALMPRLVDLTRTFAPDVVFYDSFAPWGRFIAEVLDLPAVSSQCTLVLREEDVGKVLPSDGHEDAKNLEGVAELREKWNVTTSTREIGRFFSADNIVYSSKLLNPAHAEDARIHFVGPVAREGGEHDLGPRRPGRRRVYVAMGTLAVEIVKLDVAFFQNFIDAFGGDERFDLVMAVGKTIPLDAFGKVPDNVTLRSFVPQVPLLRDVDVFITHAGANSMHEGFFAGVPLVCIPCFAEQPLNASRVAQMGAGEIVPRAEVSPKRIREAVEHVLDAPSYRSVVDRVRDDLRATGGVDHAVEVLAAAAARARYASAG